MFSRLLDELNEGLGVAQAISSEDPQFIAYVALEERLTQDMEVLKHSNLILCEIKQEPFVLVFCFVFSMQIFRSIKFQILFL